MIQIPALRFFAFSVVPEEGERQSSCIEMGTGQKTGKEKAREEMGGRHSSTYSQYVEGQEGGRRGEGGGFNVKFPKG